MAQGRRFGKMVKGAMSSAMYIDWNRPIPADPCERWITTDEERDDCECFATDPINERVIYSGLRTKGMTHKEAFNYIAETYW
jgi:hypothetical protein